MLIEFWYKMVTAGGKTIDDVPIKWREAVRKRIEEDNE